MAVVLLPVLPKHWRALVDLLTDLAAIPAHAATGRAHLHHSRADAIRGVQHGILIRNGIVVRVIVIVVGVEPRRRVEPVVHLSKPLDPVLSQLFRHHAKHGRLVLVAENLLADLDLEVRVFVCEVAKENLHRLFRPSGCGGCRCCCCAEASRADILRESNHGILKLMITARAGGGSGMRNGITVAGALGVLGGLGIIITWGSRLLLLSVHVGHLRRMGEVDVALISVASSSALLPGVGRVRSIGRGEKPFARMSSRRNLFVRRGESAAGGN